MGLMGRMNRMPDSVCVCVDGDFSGRLYHCYNSSPVKFYDIPDLFYILEKVMEEVDYPERKTKPRSFKKTNRREINLGINLDNKICEPVDLLANDGKLATFIVTVLTREYSNIQGSIYIKKTDVNESFNSDKELLELINKEISD